MLGFIGSTPASAATSPDIGDSSTYGIISSTYTNSINTGTLTDITGDLCYTTGPGAAVPVSISGATVTPCAPARGTDQSSALADLNAQVADSCNDLGVNININSVVGHLTGTYTPGCYSSSGTMGITSGTTVTLDGAGTYIFKSGGAITTGTDSFVVLTNGASASDVFWAPGGATNIGAQTATSTTPSFVGNILQNSGAAFDVTIGHFANILGRVLAFGRDVTTDSITIAVPSASSLATLRVVTQVANYYGGTAVVSDFNPHVKLSGTDVTGSPAVGVVSPGRSYSLVAGTYVVSEDVHTQYITTISGDCATNGTVTLASGDVKTCIFTNTFTPDGGTGGKNKATITVAKVIINDNGRTKTIADFSLFVNTTSVVSGVTNIFPAPAAAYVVTETGDANYTKTFSGDCDSTGHIGLSPGDNKICIITNNDIGAPIVVPPVPPLIDIVKVPSPLALPAGPGPVTYTYTLRNTGTVPVTNITMVGDTCSPINLVSGDSNANATLEVNETWLYRCSTILVETHTNIITATGWANGISDVDIASATVIVGEPIVPPLIHVTKIPSPLVLPAGEGMVTYTYIVTNPGTEPLSDVTIADDKCTGLPSRISGHPGDSNKNNLLESNETWNFTCQSKLTQTTTNTGMATGSANGLTARDVAIVTVVVNAAAPVVNTVVPKLPNTGYPEDMGTAAGFVGILIAASASFIVFRKRRA